MTARLPLTISPAGQRRQLQAAETLQTLACTTANASLNAPHGTVPSSPVNGDIWTTSAGIYVRVNGTTIGPLINSAYASALIAGLSWKQAVRAATTANGTLASAFENGDTIDGVTLATGDRILIKNQSSAAENGIYTVNASGGPTRATDADSGAELVNASIYVSEGSTLADTQWTCTTNAPITPGSTSLAFAQLTSGGGVSSVFGRTGAVVSATNDYSFSQISGTVGAAQLPIGTSSALGAVKDDGGVTTSINGGTG